MSRALALCWLSLACGSQEARTQPGSGGNATATSAGTGGVAPTPGGTNPGGAGAGGRGNEAGANVGGNVSGNLSGAGPGGASAGSQVMLTLKQPIERGDDKLVLEFGSTYFEVKPGHGGRITSLRQAGQELLWLKGADNYADAIGSTFWPSPQSWPWPPPAEIDTLAYAATVDARGVITLQGEKNDATGLRVSKRFSANLSREALELEYAMTNVGASAVKWAPWEITRLPADGLAFWPTGGETGGETASAPRGDKPMASHAELGVTWCSPAETSGEGKLFADGAGGYLAYARGDRVLVKQFQDQPASAAAPGEAEIELYVNPDHSYVEVENQGAYTSIAPGQSVSWRVVWYVRKLPAAVSPSTSHADLVAFVVKTLE